MRLFVAILGVLFIACDVIGYETDGTNIHVSTFSGELTSALEKFKEKLRHGDAKLGLPVLDPLILSHLDLNLTQFEGVSVEGTVDNVRASGLASYNVTKGDFKLAGLKVNISLYWDQIQLYTNYNLKGKLLDTLSFYGNGNVAAVLEGLDVTVDLKISIKDKHLYVSYLRISLGLEKFPLTITGLYDDEDLSKLVSDIISDIVPQLITDYRKDISDKISPVVINILNDILKNFTLKDLLDIIAGKP